MKLHFILIFWIFNCVCYSQSIENLDNKNGFKDFVFGQKKSDFISISKEKSQNIRIYTGEKYKELFDIYWDELVFAFCDEKLYSIVIDFNNSNEQKYSTLLANLERIFGVSKPNYSELGENNFKHYNSWEGAKNVYMYIRFLDDNYPLSKKCNTCNIQLEIINETIEKECLIKQF